MINKKMRALTLSAALAAMALAGCGGDDSTGTTSPSSSTTISGAAVAGPIAGQVCAYPVSGAGVVGSTALGCVNTDPATGGYSLSVTDYTGVVLLTAVGTYTDEATGLTVTIPTQSPLRSIVNLEDGGTISAAITPLTEIGVQAALTAGGLMEGPILTAFRNLASAMGLNPGGGDDGFQMLVQVIPALSGTNLGARSYGALLDLTSFAQSTWCGGNANCDLFDYLNNVSGLLASQSGQQALAQSMQGAYSQWQASQAGNDYLCGFNAGVFTCSPNTGGGNTGGGNTGGGNTGGGNTGGGNTGGGNTGGGASGSYNLNLIVTALGVSTPAQITDVPKPANQSEFCDPALNTSIGQSFGAAGGTWTMNSCTFDGSHGVITATVSITSPISMTIPYTVDYTYTAN